MRSPLVTLISKETKELLRDPRIFVLMILAPIVIFILLGQVIGYATSNTARAATSGLNLAVINEDGGDLSKLLVEFIKTSTNSKIEVFPANSDPKSILASGKFDALLLIPENFTKLISSGTGTTLQSYEVVRDISISSIAKFSAISSSINAFQQQILLGLISQAYPNLNASSLLHLISLNETAFIGGREFNVKTINSLLSGAIMLIVAPLMIFSIATSLAASSMGIEKEEKTLEILLSFPVKRSQILISKIVGAFLISLAGMVGMVIGFYYYISSITSNIPGGSVSIAESVELLSPASLVEAALGLLLSLLFLLAASILIASLANNVREAQAMASYAWLPMLIPYILLMYIDLSQLSTAQVLAISAIPASTPLIAIKASIQGWSEPVILSFLANILYFAIVLYLGARWFQGERILSSKISGKKLFRRKT
ncbi:MAG: ABC transporter permease [Fervidicoccaceae archaeon]